MYWYALFYILEMGALKKSYHQQHLHIPGPYVSFSISSPGPWHNTHQINMESLKAVVFNTNILIPVNICQKLHQLPSNCCDPPRNCWSLWISEVEICRTSRCSLVKISTRRPPNWMVHRGWSGWMCWKLMDNTTLLDWKVIYWTVEGNLMNRPFSWFGTVRRLHSL